MKLRPRPPPAKGDHGRAGPLVLWSWAFYDWANTGFALVVMTALFPVFFGDYWAADLTDADSTFWFGLAASFAGVLTALAAPFLGAVADLQARRKALLLWFTGGGAVTTAGFALVGRGEWGWAAGLYVLSVFAFSVGNLFYDSLLRGLTSRDNRHFISAAGFSLGYFGSTLLLLLALWMVRSPGTFGLADSTAATKVAFLLTAGWWGVFALPLAFCVPEPPADPGPRGRLATVARGALVELRRTLLAAWRERRVRWFLLAYFCYIDGINAIGKMALKLGSDLGFARSELLAALVLAQVTGIPCALLFGYIGQRVGVRHSLFAGIAIYLAVVVYASQMSKDPLSLAGFEFAPIYLLGLLIGMAHGGMLSLSRSFFAGLIPPQREGSFFGLYNIVGKASNILGPVLVAGVAVVTGSTQWGILSLSVFFVLGLGFLLPATAGERAR
ncbi:MAG: MFS transporter [Opitutales bacterium]